MRLWLIPPGIPQVFMLDHPCCCAVAISVRLAWQRSQEQKLSQFLSCYCPHQASAVQCSSSAYWILYLCSENDFISETVYSCLVFPSSSGDITLSELLNDLSEACVFSTYKSIQYGDLNYFVWESPNGNMKSSLMATWKCFGSPKEDESVQMCSLTTSPAVLADSSCLCSAVTTRCKRGSRTQTACSPSGKNSTGFLPRTGPCCLYAIVIEIK